MADVDVSSFFEGSLNHFRSSLSLLLFALVRGLTPALFLAAATAAALTKAIQSFKEKQKKKKGGSRTKRSKEE